MILLAPLFWLFTLSLFPAWGYPTAAEVHDQEGRLVLVSAHRLAEDPSTVQVAVALKRLFYLRNPLSPVYVRFRVDDREWSVVTAKFERDDSGRGGAVAFIAQLSLPQQPLERIEIMAFLEVSLAEGKVIHLFDGIRKPHWKEEGLRTVPQFHHPDTGLTVLQECNGWSYQGSCDEVLSWP